MQQKKIDINMFDCLFMQSKLCYLLSTVKKTLSLIEQKDFHKIETKIACNAYKKCFYFLITCKN